MTLDLRALDLPDGERAVHAVRIGDGAPVGEVSSLLALEGDDGVRVTVDADLGAVAVTVDQLFRAGPDGLTAQSYLAETWNDDRLVTREEGHFPGGHHLDLGGSGGLTGALPAGLTPIVGVMTTWRGLPFRTGLTGQVPVWLAFAVSWPVDLRVERREAVTVPAGRVQAWRVVLRPSLSALGPLAAVLEQAVGSLVPDVVLHFAADDPHPLVRAEAPTGPFPWSPKVVLELTTIELTV